MEAYKKRNQKQMVEAILFACEQRSKWRSAKNGAVGGMDYKILNSTKIDKRLSKILK